MREDTKSRSVANMDPQLREFVEALAEGIPSMDPSFERDTEMRIYLDEFYKLKSFARVKDDMWQKVVVDLTMRGQNLNAAGKKALEIARKRYAQMTGGR